MLNRRQFVTRSLAAGPAATLRARTSATAGQLRAGAATSNITPPLGCSIAGGMTDHAGAEVHDELHARCLVLDNGKTRLALVTCDLCVLPREPIERTKQLIQEHTGIPRANVLISASHTHSAPPAAHLFQSLPDPNYIDWIVLRIADGVRRAVNHLEPARIGWAVGHEERLVFNRRFHMKPGTIPPDPFGRTTDRVQMNPGIGNPNVIGPAGPVDPDVPLLAVESLDGRPICLLASYALHYVGGVGPGHISADYFAAWANSISKLAGRDAFHSYPPFVPILANACSGDINNVDVLRGARIQRQPYEQIQKVADVLAAECYRNWRTIEFTDAAELAASEEELELALRLPDADDAAAARKILAEAGPPPAGGYRDRRQIYARETLILAETYPKIVRTVVQAMRIGGLGIAALPGEAFVELGLHVKVESPFQPTMMIGLANDYRGYIPTVEAFDLGGYETWRAKSSCLEREAAPRVVAAALRRLRALA